MVGFPKNLNTREDFEYCVANFNIKLWLPEFEKLLQTAYDWITICELDDPSLGVEVDGEKRILTEEAPEYLNEAGEIVRGNTRYYQQEFKLFPTCKLLSIGYTVAEVEEIVKNGRIIIAALTEATPETDTTTDNTAEVK